jgi:hypothetical protein
LRWATASFRNQRASEGASGPAIRSLDQEGCRAPAARPTLTAYPAFHGPTLLAWDQAALTGTVHGMMWRFGARSTPVSSRMRWMPSWTP